MKPFDAEGALSEVLERKDLLTAQYRHQRDNQHSQYGYYHRAFAFGCGL